METCRNHACLGFLRLDYFVLIPNLVYTITVSVQRVLHFGRNGIAAEPCLPPFWNGKEMSA